MVKEVQCIYAPLRRAGISEFEEVGLRGNDGNVFDRVWLFEQGEEDVFIYSTSLNSQHIKWD